ncbi:ATP-binding protein [Saccharothrix saharensis]|uniref:ATP-binding protein n=1 Tax=Saccharothrix saharensis TaxID=571190 RepID=UPI0036CD85FE
MIHAVHNDMSGHVNGPVIQAGYIDAVNVSTGPVTPVPWQLPRSASPFTGREQDLRRLHDRAVPGALCVVTGTPGVGKSELVTQWAHQAGAQGLFPDGILYAGLNGFDLHGQPTDPGSVLDGFLDALGASHLTRGDLSARARHFRSVVTGRTILVFLDNAAPTGQIEHLLPGTDTATVVVTSRNQLSGLLTSKGGTLVKLEPLDDRGAVDLIRETLGDRWVDSDEPHARNLARLCAHLPVALRIALQLLVADPHTTTGELNAELGDERERLEILETDDPAVAVRAVFHESYRKLPSDQARAFRLLGVHPGAQISLPAAAALTGLPERRALRLLDNLVGASLVDKVGRHRWQMHDLLRAFAHERAEKDEPADGLRNARRTMLDWYTHTAASAGIALSSFEPPPFTPRAVRPNLTFADDTAAIEWLVDEHTNLTAASRLAHNLGEDEVAWRLAVALGGYFYRRKPWNEWVEVCQHGLVGARAASDDRAIGLILNGLATAHQELNQLEPAEQHFREALEVWSRSGDRQGYARTANGYATVCAKTDRLGEAERHAMAALAAWSELGDFRGQGIVHNQLSGICSRAGRLEEALAHSSHAAELLKSVGDRFSEIWAINNIAEVHRRAGRLEQAIELFRTVLAVRQGLGDHYGQAVTARSLGMALRDHGDVEAAITALTRSLQLFAELRDEPNAIDVRRVLGECGPANT